MRPHFFIAPLIIFLACHTAWGSPASVTDAGNVTVAKYDYDAYGNTLSSAGGAGPKQ